MPIQNVPFNLFQATGVDAKTRFLRYDMNAMADFEEKTGMGLAQLMSSNAIFATTRAMLWAGLKHQDRGLTIDRVGQWMQAYVEAGGDVQTLLGACFEAAAKQRAIPGLKRSDEVEGDGTENPPATPTALSPTGSTQIDPGPVALNTES